MKFGRYSDEEIFAMVRAAAPKAIAAGQVLCLNSLRRHGARGGDARLVAALAHVIASGEIAPPPHLAPRPAAPSRPVTAPRPADPSRSPVASEIREVRAAMRRLGIWRFGTRMRVHA